MVCEVLLLLLSAVALHLACDDIFTPPYGNLTSPNYPMNYPSDSDCITRVMLSEGSQMVITFHEFETESCKYDYLKVFPVIGGDTNGAVKLCGNQKPSQLITRNNNVTFHFHSDSSTEMKGFQLEWKVLDRITFHREPKSWLEASKSCSLLGATLVNPDDVTIQQIRNMTTISIQPRETWTGSYFTPWVWYKGCLKPSRTLPDVNITRFKNNGWAVCVGQCVKYNYFALQGDMCLCLDWFDGEFVFAVTDCKTTCPGESGEACGGEGTYTVYMNDMCFNGSINWRGTVSQTITGDRCKHWADYNVSSHDYSYGFPDGSKQNASNYCRDPTDHGSLWCITDRQQQECDVPACADEVVSTNAPSRCVEFTYGDTRVTTRQVPCSKNNSYLQVQIKPVPRGYQLIPVTSNRAQPWHLAWDSFTSMILNTGSHAGKKGGPYWRPFTRTIVNWPLQDFTETPTDCLTMVGTWGSFDEIGLTCSAKLPYFCQQAINTCGDTLTSENGTLTSPGYPVNYTAFLKCKWQIQADPGYVISLHLAFDLEKSHDCMNDYIKEEVTFAKCSLDTELKNYPQKVHDGNDTSSKIIGTWCGNGTQTIYSTWNQLTILFRSDKTVHDKGFTAEWNSALLPISEPGKENTRIINIATTEIGVTTKPSNGITKTESVWIFEVTLVALIELVSK